MRKNCEPFVFGPALAMERIPAPESNSNDRINSILALRGHKHLRERETLVSHLELRVSLSWKIVLLRARHASLTG